MKNLISFCVCLGVLLLTSCSNSKNTGVDPTTRLTHCSACNETFPLPLGYLGTLPEDGIRYSPTGTPIFNCPKCGEQAASPVPPPIPSQPEAP